MTTRRGMNVNGLTWRRSACTLLATAWLTSAPALAQSPPPAGKMWLLEEPPLEHIAEVYGAELDAEWLEKTRPAPGPGGLRRPLWMNRPLRPTDDAYHLS